MMLTLAKRIKDREKKSFNDIDRVDILLVVNMYLTGFDAKKLNTLYVDKNLKNHGLIQAFSRTNRILNEVKSQGNIVCFRNLKTATDDAIKLFSNKDAQEDNVAYILELLSTLEDDFAHGKTTKIDHDKQKKAILDIIGGEAKLRSKKELIEKFIQENLPKIRNKQDIRQKFKDYWNEERQSAIVKIREEENLVEGRLKPIIDDYLFSGIEPVTQTLVNAIEGDKKPKILELKSVTERIMLKIKDFIKTFEDDIGDL